MGKMEEKAKSLPLSFPISSAPSEQGVYREGQQLRKLGGFASNCGL